MPWESVPTDELAADPALLGAGARRGAGTASRHLAAGYAITDPNKLTLLTPGFDRRTGDYAAHGVPAPVVAQYLRENRVVPEKNDLNSLLFLLTPGVESSKAGTLLSALVAFKRLHDDNAPLEDVMPEFVAKRPQRYRGHAPARSLRRDARVLPRSGTSARCRRPVRARASAREWRCRRTRRCAS